VDGRGKGCDGGEYKEGCDGLAVKTLQRIQRAHGVSLTPYKGGRGPETWTGNSIRLENTIQGRWGEILQKKRITNKGMKRDEKSQALNNNTVGLENICSGKRGQQGGVMCADAKSDPRERGGVED